MRGQARRFGVAVVVALAVSSVCVSPAIASRGAGYVDPQADGYIALCDLAGNNVSGGSVSSTPAIWKAVASVAAPKAFRGKGQNAALLIFQARQGVPAQEWSGDTLSADSFYKNPRHPAAQMTYTDLALADIIRELPPMWNGLYELRMYVGKLNFATYSNTYPATFIKVTGNTWHVVNGGLLPCGSSTRTKSSELFSGRQLIAPASDKNQTPRTAPPAYRAVAGPDGSRDRAKPLTAAAGMPAADGAGDGSSYAAWYVAGGLLAALAAGLGSRFLVRRRARRSDA